jgi:hypothetical protein
MPFSFRARPRNAAVILSVLMFNMPRLVGLDTGLAVEPGLQALLVEFAGPIGDDQGVATPLLRLF